MKPDIRNRTDIQILIKSFYVKIQADETLGLIFAAAKVNWESHLPIMYDFWETTLFHKGIYQRNAMKVHVNLHHKIPLTKDHFDQWLKIFTNTVDELFAGENAHNAKTRAISIATMIQFKIYDSNRLI